MVAPVDPFAKFQQLSTTFAIANRIHFWSGRKNAVGFRPRNLIPITNSTGNDVRSTSTLASLPREWEEVVAHWAQALLQLTLEAR
jgi:hypothetical protein